MYFTLVKIDSNSSINVKKARSVSKWDPSAEARQSVAPGSQFSMALNVITRYQLTDQQLTETSIKFTPTYAHQNT